MKKYNYLTEIDKENIINSYYFLKDNTFEELAKRLGVSKRSVSRVLRENNINTKRKNRYTLKENFFEKIDSEEKAYLLGFIYADGFVGDEKSNNVSISSIDLEILEKFKLLLEFTGTIRCGNKGNFENSKYGYVLNFSSKQITKDLRSLGLYPNKSLTMSSLPILDERLYRHFIRGYFDGDGSVFISKNTAYHNIKESIKKYEYITFGFDMLGTESFLNEIKNKMNLKYHHIRNTKTLKIKRLLCSAKTEARSCFNYLYEDSNIFLERKYEKWNLVLSAIKK